MVNVAKQRELALPKSQKKEHPLKQLFHVLLGVLAYTVLGVAFLLSKIFRVFSAKKEAIPKIWLESFVILFLNKSLKLDGDTTDLGRLARGELDFGQDQSLIVYLKAYLYKIGETYQLSDYVDAKAAIPRVWAHNMGGFQSEGSVRAWCKAQDPDGATNDVDTFIAEITRVDKGSQEWKDFTRNLVEFRFERVFKRKFSVDYWSYTASMLDDYIDSSDSNK